MPQTTPRRHYVRNASVPMALLFLGLAIEFTLSTDSTRGGIATVGALWLAFVGAIALWLATTDFGVDRARRALRWVLAWFPRVSFAARTNAVAVAVSKPPRFLKEPTEEPPAVTPDTEASVAVVNEVIKSLTWMGQLVSAENHGEQLKAELLEARRRPGASGFPMANANLGSVAGKIKAWNLNDVAALVDRSNLTHPEKIKLPIYKDMIIGYPSAEDLAEILNGGMSYLARLRSDRSLDPD